MKKYIWIGLGVLAGLIVAFGAWFFWLKPHTFAGTVIQSPEPAPEFTLTGPNGQPVSLSDFKGKTVAMFFGYTSCPDVCPTTLSAASQAIKKLGARGENVQFLMVTVDPERDTPEKLNQYVTNFNPRFKGLWGTPEEIAKVAALYGIYYEKVPGVRPDLYTMDHTATVLVIDKNGRLKLVLPFETSIDAMASDLEYISR